MNKIQELHQFLISLGVVAAKEIDSYVDKLDVTPAGRPDGPDKLILSDTKYTATFYISGYPFNRYPVKLLIGQISAWLLESDDQRKEPNEFSVNVDVFDEDGNVADVANLEFDIIFDEQVVITRDDGGDILFNNLAYSLV